MALSTGDYAVTLRSNINYLQTGHLSDQLKLEGLCVHNGKTTKVVEVLITNQEEKILTRATFTMYVTGSISE
ncbi:protein of unknown function [Streptococcus thermophilus]|uniref:Thioesterase domain-containing protein n=1 Tax=Streptococcus thermophilus TaxID=1308 RepID=A0A8D6UES3_STRTR|nr:protein of unknown function [Streptococcus thermophilus]CAD0145851.1 protein of unknown function [Streptococcus thermophilus]CAD0152899.1 protein of unknown function [Streptococcus thermophilus]